MCGESKGVQSYCRYTSPAFDSCFFNQETGEVFDKDNNLIGYGTPVMHDSKTIGLSVNILVKSHLIKE